MRDTTQCSEFPHDVVGLLGKLAVCSRSFHDEPLRFAVFLKRSPYARDGGRRAFFDELVNFIDLPKDYEMEGSVEVLNTYFCRDHEPQLQCIVSAGGNFEIPIREIDYSIQAQKLKYLPA